MNQAFFDFIQQNDLDTPDGDSRTSIPYLVFPPGLAEFKTAWKDIDPRDFPDANNQLGTPNGIVPIRPLPDDLKALGGQQLTWDDNYITTMAWLPYLTQDSSWHRPRGCGPPGPAQGGAGRVSLRVHAARTPGVHLGQHPARQHLRDRSRARSLTPGSASWALPTASQTTTGRAAWRYCPIPPTRRTTSKQAARQHEQLPPLQGRHATEGQADQPLNTSDLQFDEATQSFPGQGAQSSVYRMFPGSKSNDLAPDGAVFSLNSNLSYAFSQAIQTGSLDPKVDKRQNYRLVAAVWLDKPNFFALDYPGPAPGLGPDGKSNLGDATGRRDLPERRHQSAGHRRAHRIPPCSTRASVRASLAERRSTRPTPAATIPMPREPTTPSPSAPPGPTIWRTATTRWLSSKEANERHVREPGRHEFSILGGEDRLSSTAMETFTQNNGFKNCFTCHNTKPVERQRRPRAPGSDGPNDVLLSKPALINVSHLFSEFLLQNKEQSGM